MFVALGKDDRNQHNVGKWYNAVDIGIFTRLANCLCAFASNLGIYFRNTNGGT